MAAPAILGKMLGRYLGGALLDGVLGQLRNTAGISLSMELTLADQGRLIRGLNRATIIAVNRASKPVRLRVVSDAERYRRYGFLAKSIGTKVQKYMQRGTVLSVIGPKMSYSRTKGKYKSGPNAGKPKRHVPFKYAPLLIHGTKNFPPKDFLTPAMTAHGHLFQARVAQEIAREISKLLLRDR